MDLIIANKTIPKVTNGSLLYVQSDITGLVNGRHIGLTTGLYVGTNNKWLPASNVTQSEAVVVPPIPSQNLVTDLTFDNVDTLTLTQSDGSPQVAVFTDITLNTVQANTITATEFYGGGNNITDINTIGNDLYMFYNY